MNNTLDDVIIKWIRIGGSIEVTHDIPLYRFRDEEYVQVILTIDHECRQELIRKDYLKHKIPSMIKKFFEIRKEGL